MSTRAQSNSRPDLAPDILTPIRKSRLQSNCAFGASSELAGSYEQEQMLQGRTLDNRQTDQSALTPVLELGISNRRQNANSSAFPEPRFGHDFGRLRIENTRPRVIQPKLTIGEPDNESEREADRIADRVLSISDRESDGRPHTQGVEQLGTVQRQETSSADLEVAPDVETRVSQLKGEGHPLPPSTRAFFEPRFGHNFSQIRLYTGARAADSARELGAQAYTLGTDIVFGAGFYAPETLKGRHLLAHELTHVLQQRPGASLKIRRAKLDDFNDKKAKHDPSKLTDAEIEATDEFKAYMNPKLIWQTIEKMTREEALLACRLMLREMRAGKKMTWTTQAREFMNTARKQLGTLKGTEKLVGKLEWVGSAESEFKSPSTAKSSFAKWLLAAGAVPTDTSRMNCWEMIMFGAFQAGMVTKARLKTIYEAAAKESGMDVPGLVEKNLCKGSKLIFDPKDPNSPEPLRGDIIIFNLIANHAAISLGTKNAKGEHEVVSLWVAPDFVSKEVKKTTIEALMPHAKVTKVKFCSSAW